MNQYAVNSQNPYSAEMLRKMEDARLADDMKAKSTFELDIIVKRLDEIINHARSVAARAHDNADRVNGGAPIATEAGPSNPLPAGSLAMISMRLDWLREAVSEADNAVRRFDNL